MPLSTAIVVVTGAVLAAAPSAAGPAGAPAEIFSGAWRADGVEVRASELYVARPLESVAAAWAREWRAEAPREPVVETARGDSRLLGQRIGDRFRTAQFSADGPWRTRVLLAARPLGAGTVRTAAPLQLPRGTRVLRELDLSEGLRRAVQWYALVPAPHTMAAHAFERAASLEGWQRTYVAPKPGPTRATDAARAGVSAWRRGGEELLIVTRPLERSTAVLLHATGPAPGHAR